MSKSIFPTFEEIDNGTKSFTEHYYRTVKGKKVRSERLKQYVLIADFEAMMIIDSITIARNKRKERLYFQFSIFGKQQYEKYPYDEKGWQSCIAHSKKILVNYRKMITSVMNEGYDAHTDI